MKTAAVVTALFAAGAMASPARRGQSSASASLPASKTSVSAITSMPSSSSSASSGVNTSLLPPGSMCNRDTQCAADTYCKWDQEKTIGFCTPYSWSSSSSASPSSMSTSSAPASSSSASIIGSLLGPGAACVADRQCAYDLHCDWSMGSAMGICTANSSIIGKLLPYGAACVNTRQCDAGLSCIWQQGQSMGSCGYGQATSFSSAPASSVTSVSSTSSVVPPPNSGAARSYAFSAGAGLAMVAAVAAAL